MADQTNEWQQALAAIDLSAIESLKKLKAEQDQLDERLKSMDELKANFAPPVFERVRADYVKRLDDLDQQAAPLKQQNAKLQAQYKIEGYPTIIVLNSQGKKVGELGYQPGGPKAFIAELDKLKK